MVTITKIQFGIRQKKNLCENNTYYTKISKIHKVYYTKIRAKTVPKQYVSSWPGAHWSHLYQSVNAPRESVRSYHKVQRRGGKAEQKCNHTVPDIINN